MDLDIDVVRRELPPPAAAPAVAAGRAQRRRHRRAGAEAQQKVHLPREAVQLLGAETARAEGGGDGPDDAGRDGAAAAAGEGALVRLAQSAGVLQRLLERAELDGAEKEGEGRRKVRGRRRRPAGRRRRRSGGRWEWWLLRRRRRRRVRVGADDGLLRRPAGAVVQAARDVDADRAAARIVAGEAGALGYPDVDVKGARLPRGLLEDGEGAVDVEDDAIGGRVYVRAVVDSEAGALDDVEISPVANRDRVCELRIGLAWVDEVATLGRVARHVAPLARWRQVRKLRGGALSRHVQQKELEGERGRWEGDPVPLTPPGDDCPPLHRDVGSRSLQGAPRNGARRGGGQRGREVVAAAAQVVEREAATTGVRVRCAEVVLQRDDVLLPRNGRGTIAGPRGRSPRRHALVDAAEVLRVITRGDGLDGALVLPREGVVRLGTEFGPQQHGNVVGVDDIVADRAVGARRVRAEERHPWLTITPSVVVSLSASIDRLATLRK